ncbi:MAG: ATP-binding cassette domain-containing protein [Labilithrix sp.]|nr:ATP-binding cassette domain-containing protein [Labilithrix sp.]
MAEPSAKGESEKSRASGSGKAEGSTKTKLESDAAIPLPGDKPRPRTLVATERVGKYFPVRTGFFSRSEKLLRAVDGVSLRVRRGETLGLVGESGCGKSTLGRLVLRLIEPTFGRVVYDGKDIVPLSAADLRPLRRKMQIIFQDPYSSLNPRMTVREIVGEAIQIHALAATKKDEEAMVEGLLRKVGLRPDVMGRYPHEFSGGQRQRIGIARALAVQPEFIVCDEPISALDVSIQAQIVNLLMDLQDELGVAFLFISHDLRVVRHISQRVAVMYLGRLVEQGTTEQVYGASLHPYTRALLGAVPVPDPEKKRLRIVVEGDAPSPIDPPAGCAFHPRCARALKGTCDKELPPLAEHTQGTGHKVACWNPHTE